MLYSGSEKAWMDWRAEKISDERGWPLSIAKSEAAAEMVRMRTRKPAATLPFRPRSASKHWTLERTRRLFHSDTAARESRQINQAQQDVLTKEHSRPKAGNRVNVKAKKD
jgi:hypothetical protein